MIDDPQIDELYPDAAPAWFQREMAYKTLEILEGEVVRELEPAPPGHCDDCTDHRERLYRYGKRNVCLSCASHRRNAVRRAA